MSKPEPIIQVKNLSKSFTKEKEVLSDISFSLFKEDFVILAGPNGSGKTVLMNHLNGLEKPSRGELLFNGIPYKKIGNDIFKKVGLIFQNSDLQFVCPDVKSEIGFGPVNLGLPKEEIEIRVREIAERFRLSDLLQRDPHSLSGGEKKRVAVAGVTVMEPEVLVLDEPFTGLDWKGVSEVLETLLLLHSKGMTIVLITHDLDKCLNHGNRLLILEKGKLQEDGDPGTLKDRVEIYGIKKPHTGSWLINNSNPKINKLNKINKQKKNREVTGEHNV